MDLTMHAYTHSYCKALSVYGSCHGNTATTIKPACMEIAIEFTSILLFVHAWSHFLHYRLKYTTFEPSSVGAKQTSALNCSTIEI